MKTYKTGSAVSNIAIKSVHGTGAVRHIFGNWKASNISEEERKYRFEHRNENKFWPGTCKNEQEFQQKIEQLRNSVSSKRQVFETKEVVFSFPIKDGMSREEQLKIASDLTNKAFSVLSKMFHLTKKDILGGQVHLNEVGRPHVHIIFNNVWKDKNGKMRFGWEGGSISKKRIVELQKQFEPLYQETMKRYGIDFLSQAENKKRHSRNGKKLKIAEYKKLKEAEEQLRNGASVEQVQKTFDDWAKEQQVFEKLEFCEEYKSNFQHWLQQKQQELQQEKEPVSKSSPVRHKPRAL